MMDHDHLWILPLGNPLEEKITGSGGSAAEWQKEVSKKLLQIKKLDGYMVVREEEDADATSATEEN